MRIPLISVVLPIYNTASYLNQCIESVARQTYENLDIILVDDGSTDNSPQICDSWAQRDGRIRVIHKQNQGQGIARNKGIEVAEGEYICFFDSDDFIAEETIEKAVRRITEEQADLVIFGLNAMDDKNKIIRSFIPKNSIHCYRDRDVQDKFLRDCLGPDPKSGEENFYFTAWVFLYSMEMIRRSGWSFVSERKIISEDVYSLTALMKYVTSVAVLPEPLYYYRWNPLSFSRSYMKDKYERIRHFYKELVGLCRENQYSEECIHRCAYPFLCNTIASMKQLLCSTLTFREKWMQLRSIICDPVMQGVVRQYRSDERNWKKRVLFTAVSCRCTALCYLLLLLQIHVS